ncbi:P-loop containing nucleoside triphosphate hydrolase protein [Chytriomyces sp. MP71]|nr:P-loop containing nucleoside triphosphate hydrolase protein [Chytriomyces sp. MP71]
MKTHVCRAGLSNWVSASSPTEDASANRFLLVDNANSVLSKLSATREPFLREMLLNILDERNNERNPIVIVFACSLTAKEIDEDFTRSGRISSIVALEMRDANSRLEVLEDILREMTLKPTAYPFLLDFCENAHGLVAADLKHVADSLVLSKADPSTWTRADFDSELKKSTTRLKPIKPPRPFSQFYGMDQVLRQVNKTIITPWRTSLATPSIPSLAPRGVLIHGPPGVGKTQFGMALAEELGFNQVVVKGSEIRSKVVGESEENIRRVFADARNKAPCVLFIDQIDALVPHRAGSDGTSEGSGNRVVTSFLIEMDGLRADGGAAASGVLVIAVTSRREAVDAAILRPGRVNEVLWIGMPGEEDRAHLFQGFLDGVPHDLSDEQMANLGVLSNGCTGADIENICREAAYTCMREDFMKAVISFHNLQLILQSHKKH